MAVPGNPPFIGGAAAGGATVESNEILLERLMSILGAADNDLRFLIPPLEGTLGANADVQDLGPRGLHAVNVTARDAVSYIRGEVLAQRYNGTDEYMTIADNALLSMLSGGVDAAFSIGCAFLTQANAALKILIAKWDDITPTAEYRLYLDAAEKINLVLFDNDVVNGSRGRLYNTALDTYQWYVVIATYNGVGGTAAAGGIDIYLRKCGDGTEWLGAVDDTDNSGAGVYVDMEDTAQPVSIGANESAAGPAYDEFFPGDMALMFLTAKQLTATEAEHASLLMQWILGL